ncbi:kinase-like domain-containing protein [Aspergillus egyptiacus]|nr:kinase-like domain-containing protein [Aspergillus egyptiacus]
MESLKNSFVPGQLLDGRFRTVAPLNHGSFGMVFLATDIQTGRDVAIKCMMKPSGNEPWSAASSDSRFEELDCHQRLAYHPNIVNLVHHFETATHLFLVLEYCANGDLYEAIRLNRGPRETEHVREFMLQLVSAVEFLHANGLYHRDIKPENIFLMQDGSMKLGDLGLATREKWCFEACVGSDRYMAPEQYDPANSGYSPAKADIWAIGICLLNVLFARNPFATPTESDILFADYVRDRQSLFDIFPNMSQDTFEILRTALAIDPERRSLSELGDAVQRAISFTTDDEVLDEFCTDEREVVPASAYREPLRTPSIQSPYVNQGDSFPWAKALQSSPAQAIRQLSAIPDTESYSEELFPPSETAGSSWFSVHQTPSMASVLESALGDSYHSSDFPSTMKAAPRYPPPSDPVLITGSLPSQAAKPIPSLSMVFGRNSKSDKISKSWSDLWEEEESEGEDIALQQRREQNSRSWSHESNTEDSNSTLTTALQERSSSVLDSRPQPLPTSARRESLEKPDGSKPIPAPTKVTPWTSRTSPKKSSVDKWTALGEKRRNFKPSDPSLELKRFPNNMTWRKDWGLGSSGFDYGLWAKKESLAFQDRRRRPFIRKEWRRDSLEAEKPAHVNPVNSQDYHGSVDEDLDLVGGWHDLHL